MDFSLKQFTMVCILALLIGSCAQQSAPVDLPDLPTAVPVGTPIPQESAAETPFVSMPTKPVIPINPLTGLLVQDPALLDLPAALVSIAHFPSEARPQAGLSYAPFVFEVYITEGATRFLATFYGEFPKPEPVTTGNCQVRWEPLVESHILLGNRVWLDENQNHVEDAWESGVRGVCINLFDAGHNLVQQTTTDSNGYFAFNVEAGQYFIEALKPNGMEFSQKGAGDESQDSDVDSATGQSDAVDVAATRLDLDVGLIRKTDSPSASELPIPYVGPVRSGRLVYGNIASFFPGSCLIFAYASAEVLDELPTCAFVDHILHGGGYMLEIEQMRQLVEARKDVHTQANYTSNRFSVDAPEGGLPADRLDVYFAWLNQSAWAYDAASQSWWRYVDNADPESAGILRPEVDRLNNRQLKFENVMVLFTNHVVVSPTNLDIRLQQDREGEAFLFRDGRFYEVRWSTNTTEDEIASGVRRPIRFYYPDSPTLFPLKPGHTWITIVTPQTSVTQTSVGKWLLQFSQPEGAK